MVDAQDLKSWASSNGACQFKSGPGHQFFCDFKQLRFSKILKKEIFLRIFFLQSATYPPLKTQNHQKSWARRSKVLGRISNFNLLFLMAKHFVLELRMKLRLPFSLKTQVLNVHTSKSSLGLSGLTSFEVQQDFRRS